MTDPQPPQPVEPPAKKPRAAQIKPRPTSSPPAAPASPPSRPISTSIALSESRGYGAPGLAEGSAACDLAQEKFNAREIAMDNKRIASKALKNADTAARSGYADFCRISSKVFKYNANARAALVLPARTIQNL